MAKTIVALDLDGVVFFEGKKQRLKAKHLSFPTKEHENITVYWKESVAEKLSEVFSRDEVTGMFFTSWLSDDAALTVVEEALGFTGLVPLKAPYPVDVPYTSRLEVLEGDFQGWNLAARTKNWWKIKSWEMLLEDHKPDRFAFLDDELNRIPGNRRRFPAVSYEELLIVPNRASGLLPADFNVLDTWLDMEKNTNE